MKRFCEYVAYTKKKNESELLRCSEILNQRYNTKIFQMQKNNFLKEDFFLHFVRL